MRSLCAACAQPVRSLCVPACARGGYWGRYIGVIIPLFSRQAELLIEKGRTKLHVLSRLYDRVVDTDQDTDQDGDELSGGSGAESHGETPLGTPL